MKVPIKSKLPNTGISIFTVMSSLAGEYNAINLGQGTPDFEINENLIDLVTKAMKEGHNQYAHRNGLLLLREAIAEKEHFLYGNTLNPATEITITPGATYAIYTALTSFLKPGDEVIVFEPAYDSYVPNIVVNGAIPVLIPLTYPDYKINWKVVKEKISSATKAIILNSPNNPTGSILNEQDIRELRNIVEGTEIILISDEVYEHIVFDGCQHQSILKYPDLFERSFAVFSFGKVFHCTGWKMGYCIAPDHLMKEFLKVHQYNCFCVNTPMQYALASFLNNKNEYLQLSNFFEAKRDYFQNLMKETRFIPLPSKGSYFQLYSFASISEESEINFATTMTKKAGVASIPVSAFYQDGKENKVLRFCFAKKEKTLSDAVERIINFEKKFFTNSGK